MNCSELSDGLELPREQSQALREKEEYNFALFQHSPVPITVVDREGRTIKSNLARKNSGQKWPELGEMLFGGDDAECSVDCQKELLDY